MAAIAIPQPHRSILRSRKDMPARMIEHCAMHRSAMPKEHHRRSLVLLVTVQPPTRTVRSADAVPIALPQKSKAALGTLPLCPSRHTSGSEPELNRLHRQSVFSEAAAVIRSSPSALSRALSTAPEWCRVRTSFGPS